MDLIKHVTALIILLLIGTKITKAKLNKKLKYIKIKIHVLILNVNK